MYEENILDILWDEELINNVLLKIITQDSLWLDEFTCKNIIQEPNILVNERWDSFEGSQWCSRDERLEQYKKLCMEEGNIELFWQKEIDKVNKSIKENGTRSLNRWRVEHRGCNNTRWDLFIDDIEWWTRVVFYSELPPYKVIMKLIEENEELIFKYRYSDYGMWLYIDWSEWSYIYQQDEFEYIK